MQKKIASKSDYKYFLAPKFVEIFFHSLRNKIREKKLGKKYLIFFNYCVGGPAPLNSPVRGELDPRIRYWGCAPGPRMEAYTKISKSQKLKTKILLNEKFQKNRKIVFAYVSEHLVSVGTPKKCGHFLRKEGELHNIIMHNNNLLGLAYFVHIT